MRFYNVSQFVSTELTRGAVACGLIGSMPITKIAEKHFDEMRDVCLDGIRARWAVYCAEEHLGCPELEIRCGYASEQLCRLSRETIFKSHASGYCVDLVPANGKFDIFVKFVDGYFGDLTRKYDRVVVCSENGNSWIHIEFKGECGNQRRLKLRYSQAKMQIR